MVLIIITFFLHVITREGEVNSLQESSPPLYGMGWEEGKRSMPMDGEVAHDLGVYSMVLDIGIFSHRFTGLLLML